jgi:hypothetical protein
MWLGAKKTAVAGCFKTESELGVQSGAIFPAFCGTSHAVAARGPFASPRAMTAAPTS